MWNWSQNAVSQQAFLINDERRWDSMISWKQKCVVWQEEHQFNLQWKRIQQEIQEWEIRALLM